VEKVFDSKSLEMCSQRRVKKFGPYSGGKSFPPTLKGARREQVRKRKTGKARRGDLGV